MDAMFRREVYATTGTRIRVRFFGGWQFTDADLPITPDSAYQKGVPMGGTLSFGNPQSGAPGFLVEAARPADGDNLDRIQIIKGWIDSQGNPQEQVFDVAWSGNRTPNEDSKLPALPDTVDRKPARWWALVAPRASALIGRIRTLTLTLPLSITPECCRCQAPGIPCSIE